MASDAMSVKIHVHTIFYRHKLPASVFHISKDIYHSRMQNIHQSQLHNV